MTLVTNTPGCPNSANYRYEGEPVTATIRTQPGDYVEITAATHAASGVRGHLTHIDDADPVNRYRIHCDGGLFAWATQIRPVPIQPTPAESGSSPKHDTARARRRRTPTI